MVAELLVDVDLLPLTTKSAVRRSSGGFGLGSADCVRGAGASAVTIVNCMTGPLTALPEFLKGTVELGVFRLSDRERYQHQHLAPYATLIRSHHLVPSADFLRPIAIRLRCPPIDTLD